MNRPGPTKPESPRFATAPPANPPVTPLDQHNQQLLARVRPADWQNPTPAPRYNLVVIGGGTAGLVAAAGAAGLGAKVALIERHLLGGDCLNVGCVPSKALLRSSRVLQALRAAPQFGITLPGEVQIDFAAVMERVRKIRAGLSPHDSAQRFANLGVDVFLGHARFDGPDQIRVGNQILRFQRAVIATGARALHPAISGLAETGFLTNETVFNLTERPTRLAVIGGGPIGCELAQAFQRLGSQDTLFHNKSSILDRDDPAAAAIVQDVLQRDGVRLVLDAPIQRVEKAGSQKVVHFQTNGRKDFIIVNELLVGAGRAPNVDGMGLEKAGVEFDPRAGVKVDDHLRTTQPRIFAAGDVCLSWKFTHAADFAARIVIQNALFRGRKKLSALTMPWTTYTDPEVAQIGLTEAEARRQGVELDTYTRQLSEVDRAVMDGEEEGFVKIHARKGTDRIVGATIVARHAGEMISEISVAMAGRIGLGKLASVIHPYPTQAEAIRQLGDAYNRTRLTPLVKSLLSRWLAWTR